MPMRSIAFARPRMTKSMADKKFQNADEGKIDAEVKPTITLCQREIVKSVQLTNRRT
jgi:hypothetical protein